MAEIFPTLLGSISAARDRAREMAAPYVSGLPDWLEPHAVDVVAGLVLAATLLFLAACWGDLWNMATWLLRGRWRSVGGYKASENETIAMQQAVQRADEAARRIEDKGKEIDR